MSHELRTPLSAILGFAQLVQTGSPLPTATQKRSIDQILQAGWYLLDLINEILDLALIESGKLSLSLEPTSLADVMYECQAMIEPQARMNKISVAFPLFESPNFVRADRTRLKQVLINLLSNAIKYNKPHGTVVVELIAGAQERIRIRVRDSGEGLPPEKTRPIVPAVQSPRPGVEHRGRHRHRPGRVQAAGRMDGGRHRRGKHGR